MKALELNLFELGAFDEPDNELDSSWRRGSLFDGLSSFFSSSDDDDVDTSMADKVRDQLQELKKGFNTAARKEQKRKMQEYHQKLLRTLNN